MRVGEFRKLVKKRLKEEKLTSVLSKTLTKHGVRLGWLGVRHDNNPREEEDDILALVSYHIPGWEKDYYKIDQIRITTRYRNMHKGILNLISYVYLDGDDVEVLMFLKDNITGYTDKLKKRFTDDKLLEKYKIAKAKILNIKPKDIECCLYIGYLGKTKEHLKAIGASSGKS